MEQRETSLRLHGSQSKLVARDLSESLGKLPPQALDLEEAVLGAVMLERGALEQIGYLKPNHFYLEKHAIIFDAILAVAQTGAFPDMLLVNMRLRETGKSELVGGAYYLAELTSKVSSGANIDYNARIIVEMSMKRNMIQLASQIHHKAYDDTNDVFVLLQKFQDDLKFLEERETASSGPERIKQLWSKTLITDKPEELPPLVWIDQTPVCTPGNHTLLIGKKKSRKSLLVTYLLHLFLKSRENLADHVAVFDTEQGKLHVWKGKDRLYRMTNQHVPFFWLRGKSPAERREFIAASVTNWNARSAMPLKIIVIDGIRDCMSNINDPDETTEVLVWLEQLTLQHNLNVINILHENKNDNNARGHIGSELLNKAECTIRVVYDDRTTNSIVECESSREKPFEPFAFTHGPTGLPELIGMPIGKDQVNQDDQITRLSKVFDGEMLKYKELKEQIMIKFDTSDGTAKKLIQKFIDRGWILKNGKDRSPTTVYKIMVQPSTNGQHAPTIRAPEQPELFDLEPDPESRMRTNTDGIPF